MTQSVSDSVRIMRLAIGRRNTNDPDSNDDTLLGYINDFVSLSMSDDVKIFEQWSTLEFDITDGVDEYDFPDGSATSNDFVNISIDGLVSLKSPVDGSTSWNKLQIYQDPGEFWNYWGFNNKDTLTEGFPTQMLYYDGKFTFRTVPDQTYIVRLYGYKRVTEFSDITDDLPQDYWMRYIAYGAALNYARDYSLDPGRMAIIERTFSQERQRLMTRTHNQIKIQRCMPQF